jgi:hypothetical protein
MAAIDRLSTASSQTPSLPTTVNAASSSTSPSPTNQDNTHDMIYSADDYYYLFYVSDSYVYYISSPSTTVWSSPVALFPAGGVNQGQAFSTYYDTITNTMYWVIGDGITSFVIASAQLTYSGHFGPISSHTYSDDLGYTVNQPSISLDSLGNILIDYEGKVSGVSVNVVVDRIAAGTKTVTNLLDWSSGQITNDWDGKTYPYGSGGAFVLTYSSLHSGGSATPGTTSIWSYLDDYNGSAWLPVIELTTYQEVTHGNGFTIGDVFYYSGQADVGTEGVSYNHTLGATIPPVQTVVFPQSIGIVDGYGSLSWDGQNTIVAYYDSGITVPYTVWYSVSTNLGSSWTTPTVLSISTTALAPETLGTNLVIHNGISNAYWAVDTTTGTSILTSSITLSSNSTSSSSTSSTASTSSTSSTTTSSTASTSSTSSTTTSSSLTTRTSSSSSSSSRATSSHTTTSTASTTTSTRSPTSSSSSQASGASLPTSYLSVVAVQIGVILLVGLVAMQRNKKQSHSGSRRHHS